MKIALAGAGAFGEKHLDGLKLIDAVEGLGRAELEKIVGLSITAA